ncbi:MAG: hypothetical protein INQ03_12625 [Candidatus Heimdallarchaeota archaeon]|nr:hypothetical protein [Candidatus Heimdallarchaeota archaeon]
MDEEIQGNHFLTLHRENIQDLILSYYSHVFDDVKERKSMNVGGIIFDSGGIYKESAKIAGMASISSGLMCNELNVAGKTTFKDVVIAKGDAKIAGTSNFFEDTVIFGSLKVAGNAHFDSRVLLTGNVKTAGKLFAKEFYASEVVVIEGSVSAGTLIVKELIIKGRLTSEFVKTKRLLIERGGGTINGDLETEELKINPQSLMVSTHGNLSNLLNLVTYIGSTLKRTLIRSLENQPKNLEVLGNVTCNKATLHNTIIHGNLVAQELIIGQNVTIKGTVDCSNIVYLEEIKGISSDDTERKSLKEKIEEVKQD